jgi:hypothetical protein
MVNSRDVIRPNLSVREGIGKAFSYSVEPQFYLMASSDEPVNGVIHAIVLAKRKF